jgi:hypothetical protein
MEQQMVRISVEVRSGTARFRVGVSGPRASARRWPWRGAVTRDARVRVVFSKEPEGFFVREPSALAGAAGSKQVHQGAA